MLTVFVISKSVLIQAVLCWPIAIASLLMRFALFAHLTLTRALRGVEFRSDFAVFHRRLCLPFVNLHGFQFGRHEPPSEGRCDVTWPGALSGHVTRPGSGPARGRSVRLGLSLQPLIRGVTL